MQVLSHTLFSKQVRLPIPSRFHFVGYRCPVIQGQGTLHELPFQMLLCNPTLVAHERKITESNSYPLRDSLVFETSQEPTPTIFHLRSRQDLNLHTLYRWIAFQAIALTITPPLHRRKITESNCHPCRWSGVQSLLRTNPHYLPFVVPIRLGRILLSCRGS